MHFAVTSHQLHTNFTPTSHELHTNFTQLHMRVTKLRFFPALLRRPFFWARFSSCPQDFGIPVGEHGACIKTSKNEFGGVKNCIFWPLRGSLAAPSRTSRVLHGYFTATSQQLHSNFTRTSPPLHANFTRTSQTSHRFTITKSVTKLRRYPAVLGGGHYGFYLRDTSAIQFQVSYPFAFRRANGNDQFPVTTHLLPEGTRPYLRLCPSVYQYVSHFPRSYVKDRLWDFAFYGLRTREPC